YKLSDNMYHCQLDLDTDGNIETINYPISILDTTESGQWVITRILSGKTGSIKTFEQYQNDIVKPQQLEMYNSHNERMIKERQIEYSVLNTKSFGLQQIGEYSQEEYQKEYLEIKSKYPKLEEMTLEEKQAMY